VLAALVGLSAAGAALWFVNNQAPAPMPRSGAGVPDKARAQVDDRGKYTTEPGPGGVNIDSIPLDPGMREGTGASKGPGRGVRPGESGAHLTRPGKTDKPGQTETVELQAEPQDKQAEPEAAKPEPFEPEVLPPPEEKAPPMDQRAPLNRASALTALSNAAGQAASCKRDGGPTGIGTVSVVFSPNGPVASVSVSAPFGGTAVGSCVQTVFRNVRVQPFSGSAVTLSKSFRIAE
jgi:hypothetical protein